MSAAAAHFDRKVKSIAAFTASVFHNTKYSPMPHVLNRVVYSIFNYNNISSVLLIMSWHRLESSALHAVQRDRFCFREFPRSNILDSGHFCQGNTTICFLCVFFTFPWAFTVVGVTDRRLCYIGLCFSLTWACLCSDILLQRPARKTLSEEINLVIVR